MRPVLDTFPACAHGLLIDAHCGRCEHAPRPYEKRDEATGRVMAPGRHGHRFAEFARCPHGALVPFNTVTGGTERYTCPACDDQRKATRAQEKAMREAMRSWPKVPRVKRQKVKA